MLSKEYFRWAVVADRKEMDDLNDYVSERTTTRRFSKPQNLQNYDLPTPHKGSSRSQSPRKAPFHFLRNDLTLLLGPSGHKLITNTWSKHHLRTIEQDPSRLRPALVRLFSVAARIAAPKGLGHALKRLVGDFERLYFPIVADADLSEHRKEARRFAVLSVLQNGQGGHLLSGILGASSSHSDGASSAEFNPSRHIERDPVQARRQFLFEAAYRSKSWSEAYKQARLISPTQHANPKFETKFIEVYRSLQCTECAQSKKKQALVDLACCSSQRRLQRVAYALKAASSLSPACRPGELEKVLCDLLPAGDPWWRSSLSRLYRHRPVATRWTSDFRRLCQVEPSSRDLCKVVLNILGFSRTRATLSLQRHRLIAPCLEIEPKLARIRLERVRETVKVWLDLAPPSCTHPSHNGTLVNLSNTLWGCITDACLRLHVEVPVQVRVSFQTQPALVLQTSRKRLISVNPDFLASSQSEQKMLLARAVFRHAGGLEQLEQRALDLFRPKPALSRALDYAEWSGHDSTPLEQLPGEPDINETVVALEEMYWTTHDTHYRRLAEVVNQGCWCPLFDREADLFGSSFVDIVSASHALLKTQSLGPRCAQAALEQGLGFLTGIADDCPAVILRLQTLWLASAESFQQRSPRGTTR
jgi:hypothetical protein